MISPRHHAISLAAVFLALAVGVVLGSGLLSDTLLAGLRDDKRNLHERISGLEKQNNGLNEKLNSTGEFDSTMAARIIHNALADKSVQEALLKAGIEPVSSTPEQLRGFVASEIKKWADIVKAAGIQPE